MAGHSTVRDLEVPPWMRLGLVKTTLLGMIAAGTLLPVLLSSPGVRSQAEVPIPELQIHMGHHVVTWAGPPGTAYTVRVTNPTAVTAREPAGEKAYVIAVADEHAHVRARLRYRTNFFNHKQVEVGDRFEVGLEQGPALLDFVVPDFAADVSDDGRWVHGRAPAGATLTVTLETDSGAAPFERALNADADGLFQVELPEASRLAEGEGGRTDFIDGQGHRYVAVFARRWVEITVDSTRILTRASQQSPIAASRVVTRDGRARLRGFGIDVPRQEGLSADGRRKLIDSYPYLLRAGQTITVSQVGGGMARDDHWPRRLPEFRMHLDGRRVLGQAPPNAALEILLLAPEDPQPHLRQNVRADATGVFALDVPDTITLEAGWRAAARLDTGDGIWLRAETAVPRFEASVAAGRLGLDLLPFQLVTVTLRAPDGLVRYTGAHRADADGRFEDDLDSGLKEASSGWNILVDIRPGDRLEIELEAGDPWSFPVPPLSASSDPDSETISGLAEPGQEIEVRVVELPDSEGKTPRLFQTRAGLDGRWRLDLAGQVDLEPSRYARVDATVRGQRFFVYSAPRAVMVFPRHRYVESAPGLGYVRSLTLTTPAGRVAGTDRRILRGLDPPFEYPEYSFQFDRFDSAPAILPGDTVTWRSGFDEAELVVPPLAARTHVEEDLVVGRTVPGGRLTIQTEPDDPITNQIFELQADASGLFQHRFEGFDLRYNSVLDLRLELGRHQIAEYLEAPGFLLDLTEARLEGHLEPEVTLRALLGDPTAPSARGLTATDSDADFELWLDTADGRLPALRTGQALRVDAPGAELTKEVEWRIPRLDVSLEDTHGIRGATEPGSAVHLQRAGSMFRSYRRSGTIRPKVLTDGSWATIFERPARAPGVHTIATALLPDGHVVERRVVEPFLAAHHGTNQVCGVGMPDTEVRVESRDDADRLLARAEGRVSRRGEFDLRLKATQPSESPSLETGQHVVATIGETHVEYVLGPVEVEIDETAGRLRARVQPNARVEIRSPAISCLRRDLYRDLAFARAGGGSSTIAVRADDTGLVDRSFEMRAIAFGLGVMVDTPEGHGYFKTIFPKPSITAWVGEGRVTGLANPSSDLQFRLLDPEDQLLGEGSAIATPDDGRYEAHILGADATGHSPAIEPGDRITLDGGGTRSDYTVEDLSFDFDLLRGLAVRAPAGRRIELRFEHPAGASTLAVEADAAGHFRFGPEDVPPRTGWTFADLHAIEVLLPAPDGHATGSAWRAPEPPLVPLWLPWLLRP